MTSIRSRKQTQIEELRITLNVLDALADNASDSGDSIHDVCRILSVRQQVLDLFKGISNDEASR